MTVRHICLFLSFHLAALAGAQALAPVSPTPEFSFQAMQKIIVENRLTSIEAVLPFLPEALRSNYTLAYDSQSSQGASPLAPRVIMFGKTARSIVSFNGDASQKGFNTLEMIDFNSAHNSFDFHQITFPTVHSTDQVVRFSEKNPLKCMGCHGGGKDRDARPNWNEYPDWPGFYGSGHDFLQENTLENFRSYRKSAETHGRYRHLLNNESSEFSPFTLKGGSNHLKDRPNSRFSVLLSQLAAKRIARQIVTSPHADLRRDLYLLLQTGGDEELSEQEFQTLKELGMTLPEKVGAEEDFLRDFLRASVRQDSDWSLEFMMNRMKRENPRETYWNGVHWLYHLVGGELAQDLMRRDVRFAGLFQKTDYFDGKGRIDAEYPDRHFLNQGGKYIAYPNGGEGATAKLLLARIRAGLKVAQRRDPREMRTCSKLF